MGWLPVLALGACVAMALVGSGEDVRARAVATRGAPTDTSVPVARQLHPGPGAGVWKADAVQPVALTQGSLVLPMGVSLVPMTRAIAQSQGIRYSSGGYVASVAAGSPAERAGLAPGDVINRINGQ